MLTAIKWQNRNIKMVMVQFLLCLSMQTVIMFCYYRSTLVNLQFFSLENLAEQIWRNNENRPPYRAVQCASTVQCTIPVHVHCTLYRYTVFCVHCTGTVQPVKAHCNLV